MNRLDRFRFGRVHRRRVFNIVVIVAVIFMIALVILAVLGIFGIRSELPRVRIYDQPAGTASNGIGINLDKMPTSNRIRNASFDSENGYQILTVADAVGDHIFFDPESTAEGLYDEVGNGVKIMSLDSDGVMSVRFSSQTEGFDEAGFGMVTKIEDTDGFWINDPVVKTACVSSTVDVLTESGRIIADITSEQLIKEYEDTDDIFTDIFGSETGIFALSTEGRVFFSADGRTFSMLSDCPEEEVYATGIVAVGTTPVFMTEDSSLYIVSSGKAVKVDTPFEGNILMMGSNGTFMTLADDLGNIYTSYNGLVFTTAASLATGSLPVSVEVTPDSSYILDSSGKITIIGAVSGEIQTLDASSSEPVSMTVSDDGRIVVVTTDLKACLISSSTGELLDLTTASGAVEKVFRGTDGRFITENANNLYFATVLSALRVSDEVPADAVMTGDICMISSLEDGVDGWVCYGEGTGLSTEMEDSSCAVLTGEGEGDHTLTQTLDMKCSDNFSDDTFYRISLTLKSSDSSVKDAVVWLNGTTFGNVGFTVDGITDKFETYSFVFAVTENMISEEDVIRFNISFEGEGELSIDDIYVGEDRYDTDYVPDVFKTSLAESSPAAIRYDYLGIGSSGFSDERFYSNDEGSLETALRLSRDSGACPWLVIGSCSGREDVDALMDYLCGSVSSEYGKKRIDNGTALPWGRQFDTIYIEIRDDDGIFTSDAQRGAYVSYIIDAFNRSQYYLEVKDSMVLLDGMDYEGGTVLSSADFHTSDLDFRIASGYRGTMLEQIETFFSDSNYDAPRMASHSADAGEFISSLSIELPEDRALTAGELTSILTNRNASSFIRMMMVDLPLSDRPVDTESDLLFSMSDKIPVLQVMPTLSMLEYSEGIYFEVLDPLDMSAGGSASGFMSACSTLVADNGDGSYIIVSNCSGSVQQFITEGLDLSVTEATALRYSASGDLLSERTVRGNGRFTLQSGETLIIKLSGQ